MAHITSHMVLGEGSGYCLGLGFRVLGHLPGAELTTVRVEAAFL